MHHFIVFYCYFILLFAGFSHLLQLKHVHKWTVDGSFYYNDIMTSGQTQASCFTVFIAFMSGQPDACCSFIFHTHICVCGINLSSCCWKKDHIKLSSGWGSMVYYDWDSLPKNEKSVSAHPNAGRRSSEIFLSTKHCWSFTSPGIVVFSKTTDANRILRNVTDAIF